MNKSILIFLLILLATVSFSYNATGGVITYDGNYTVHTFTSNGTFNVTLGDTINVSVLVVAGGGGGGGGGTTSGGGGGAGGLIYNTSYDANGNITITIGVGGTGGATNARGNNGTNSVFGALTAIKGGGGGGSTTGATGNGFSGGSGGGGYGRAGGAGTGGTGTSGQGYAGGNGLNTALASAGGGGGASAVGQNAVAGQGGNGGAGSSNNINGSSVCYAGGGGGGIAVTGTAGTASCGGGAGSIGASGVNATANSGGGGGGANGGIGGNGGSGIVIVRFLTIGPPKISFASPTPANNTNVFTYPIGIFNCTSDTALSDGNLIEIDDVNNSATLSADNLSFSYTPTYSEHVYNHSHVAKCFGNASGTYVEGNETRYVPYYGCGNVISSMSLLSNITTNGQYIDCFTIGANDIILDGQGFDLTGTYSVGEFFGIVDLNLHSNITVKNFVIHNAWNGMHLITISTYIINNTIYDVANRAVFLAVNTDYLGTYTEIHDNNMSSLEEDIENLQLGIVYNNWFDAQGGPYISAVQPTINMNTTKTLGTNIVGGSYIGGNYYFTSLLHPIGYKGADYDGDGIGDSRIPFLVGSSYGLDYLPLTNNSASIYFVSPTPSNDTNNFTYGLTFNMTSSNSFDDAYDDAFSGAGYFEIDGTNTTCTLSDDNLSCSYTLPYSEHIFNHTYSVIGYANFSGNYYPTNETRVVPYYGCGYINSNATLLGDISNDYTLECLTINTSVAVVNCNNYRVNGKVGIKVLDNSNNIYIQNCQVDTNNTEIGIYLNTGMAVGASNLYNISVLNSGGIYAESEGINADNITIINSTDYGIYCFSGNCSLSNIHTANITVNAYFIDIFVTIFNLTNAILDTELGQYQNYSNISVYDTLSGESYAINWTTNSSTMPTSYFSFDNKFINISTVSGTPSIDSLTFNWLDSESIGHDENTFKLYKWNGSWSALNTTPDTTNNELSLFNFAPATDYGILEGDALNFVSPTPLNGINNFTYGMVFNFSSDTNMIGNGYIEIDGINQTCTLSGNLSCSYTLPYASHLFNNSYDLRAFANVSGTYYTNTTPYNFSYYGCGYVNGNATLIGNTSRSGGTCFTTNSTYLIIDGAGYTIDGDDTAGAYGIFINYTNYTTFKNALITDFATGIYVQELKTNITNNTVHDCAIGMEVASETNASINIFYNNTDYGAYIRGTESILTNNTIYNNTDVNIYVAANNVVVSDNLLYTSAIGMDARERSNVSLNKNHYWKNTCDLAINGTLYTATNEVFDSNGSLANYTNLSFVASNTNGTINFTWTANSSVMPTSYFSFNDKFINISIISGTPSINNITWNWLDSESVAPYNESKIHLYKYNGTWTDLNSTPDTTNNQILLFNFAPGSDYGLLDLNFSAYFISPTPTNQSNTTDYPVVLNITATSTFSSPCYFEIDGTNYTSTSLATDNLSCYYDFYPTIHGHTYNLTGYVNNSGTITTTNETWRQFNWSDTAWFASPTPTNLSNISYTPTLNVTSNIAFDNCVFQINGLNYTGTMNAINTSCTYNFTNMTHGITNNLTSFINVSGAWLQSNESRNFIWFNSTICIELVDVFNINQNATPALNTSSTLLYILANITLNNTCMADINDTEYDINDSSADATWISYLINLTPGELKNFTGYQFRIPITYQDNGSISASYFPLQYKNKTVWNTTYSRTVNNISFPIPYVSPNDDFRVFSCGTDSASCTTYILSTYGISLAFTSNGSFVRNINSLSGYRAFVSNWDSDGASSGNIPPLPIQGGGGGSATTPTQPSATTSPAQGLAGANETNNTANITISSLVKIPAKAQAIDWRILGILGFLILLVFLIIYKYFNDKLSIVLAIAIVLAILGAIYWWLKLR